MSKRFKTCILHIGTEKTGTSTVQSFLNLNRKALLNEGFLFPQTYSTYHGSQWEFVAVCHKTPWTMDLGRACNIANIEDQDAFRETFTSDLNQQFSKHSHADSLIISSEHFHSRLSTEKMISDLKTFLDPWVETYKIIVYFRRQDKLSMSYYSTRIKSGAPVTALLLPKTGPEKRYFDYKWMFYAWGKYFGTEAIIPRLYSHSKKGPHGILGDFCALTKISLTKKQMPEWLNHSVNAEGLSLINAAHRFFGKEKTEQEADLLAQLIHDITNTHRGHFFPASRSDAEDFYAQFIADNEFVRANALPEKHAPIFDEDFSDYPETSQTLPDVELTQIEEMIEAFKLKQSGLTRQNILRKIRNKIQTSLGR